MNKSKSSEVPMRLSCARYDDAILRHRHATLAPPLLVGDPLGSPHLPGRHSSHLGCLHTKEQSQRHVEQWKSKI